MLVVFSDRKYFRFSIVNFFFRSLLLTYVCARAAKRSLLCHSIFCFSFHSRELIQFSSQTMKTNTLTDRMKAMKPTNDDDDDDNDDDEINIRS